MKAPLSLIAALALPICLSAQPPSDTSTGISTAGLNSLELEIITPEQIEAYQHGTPASAITLATGETLENFLAGGIPKFELCEVNIDTGGDLSGGGPFSFLRTRSASPWSVSWPEARSTFGSALPVAWDRLSPF